MISLDWKERLKIDTEDFVSHKLSQKYYDVDIVYNAYPKRIDNKIPSEVIIYVAKILGVLVSKKIEEQIEFMDYLWEKKGENGHIIFTHLMKIALRKKPQIFLDYLKKKLFECSCQSEMKALVKTLIPLFKKDPKKYADIIYTWFGIDNPVLHKAIISLFLKVVDEDSSLLKYIFQKMERGWLYPTPHTIRNSSAYLKDVYKIDPDFYYSVYLDYKTSRNPVFVEILCGALNNIEEEKYRSTIIDILTNWSKSGNIKIKKAAIAGLKKFGIKAK